MPQKFDSDPAALFGDVVFGARINLMIAETAEHARVGAKPSQLAETGIQRIAGARDQIARHQRDVARAFRSPCRWRRRIRVHSGTDSDGYR